MMQKSEQRIQAVRALLKSTQKVVVLTGAGMSAESGVPTFRGPDGLWNNYRPEELASPAAFARDPRLVWEWYGWRRNKVAQCHPNPGHVSLAQYCYNNAKSLIVTQNVDGLHEAAAREMNANPDGDRASDSDGDRAPIQDSQERIIALHGRLFTNRCTACGHEWLDQDPVDASDMDCLPHCPKCQALARPAIVWFGENLKAEDMQRAFHQAEQAEVCLVVGTAGVVQPAASIAAITKQAGGQVIEVNIQQTPISALASYVLQGGAAQILPQILLD